MPDTRVEPSGLLVVSVVGLLLACCHSGTQGGQVGADAGVSPVDGGPSLDDAHVSEEAGTDGGSEDAAVDAATDAAMDAATDAAMDATMDAATDAATDAAMDAATDAATDAAIDAAIDATAGESMVVGPEGGLLAFDNGIELDVPEGAFGEETELQASLLDRQASQDLLDQMGLIDKTFLAGVSLQPTGLRVPMPITVRVPLQAAGDGFLPLHVVMDPGRGTHRIIPTPVTIDREQHVVEFQVYSFSEHGVAEAKDTGTDSNCSEVCPLDGPCQPATEDERCRCELAYVREGASDVETTAPQYGQGCSVQRIYGEYYFPRCGDGGVVDTFEIYEIDEQCVPTLSIDVRPHVYPGQSEPVRIEVGWPVQLPQDHINTRLNHSGVGSIEYTGASPPNTAEYLFAAGAVEGLAFFEALSDVTYAFSLVAANGQRFEGPTRTIELRDRKDVLVSALSDCWSLTDSDPGQSGSSCELRIRGPQEIEQWETVRLSATLFNTVLNHEVGSRPLTWEFLAPDPAVTAGLAILDTTLTTAPTLQGQQPGWVWLQATLTPAPDDTDFTGPPITGRYEVWINPACWIPDMGSPTCRASIGGPQAAIIGVPTTYRATVYSEVLRTPVPERVLQWDVSCSDPADCSDESLQIDPDGTMLEFTPAHEGWMRMSVQDAVVPEVRAQRSIYRCPRSTYSYGPECAIRFDSPNCCEVGTGMSNAGPTCRCDCFCRKDPDAGPNDPPWIWDCTGDC